MNSAPAASLSRRSRRLQRLGHADDRTTRRPSTDSHSPLRHADLTGVGCALPRRKRGHRHADRSGDRPGIYSDSRRSLDMRYRGQEHTVEVAVDVDTVLDRAGMTAAFHERHQRRYTFALQDTAVEIVNLRVTATASIARPTVGLPSPNIGSNPRKGCDLCTSAMSKVPIMRNRFRRRSMTGSVFRPGLLHQGPSSSRNRVRRRSFTSGSA